MGITFIKQVQEKSGLTHFFSLGRGAQFQRITGVREAPDFIGAQTGFAGRTGGQCARQPFAFLTH
ncbi:MAG: hypothetical protein PVS3B3_29390 [Ktedonobacteraceae bacterium]